MNIEEVINQYGPAVFASDEIGVVITINGSYLSWWARLRDGTYINVECRSGHPSLYELTVAKAMDLGEAWFREFMRADER